MIMSISRRRAGIPHTREHTRRRDSSIARRQRISSDKMRRAAAHDNYNHGAEAFLMHETLHDIDHRDATGQRPAGARPS